MTQETREEHDRRIEREARRGHSLTLADVIGRHGGGREEGSPVPPLQQTQNTLILFIRETLQDVDGALIRVLTQQIRSQNTLIDQHRQAPLKVLELLFGPALYRESRLVELVREVDFQWGHMMQERPFFERPGQTPDPDDPYTLASVRVAIQLLLDTARVR